MEIFILLLVTLFVLFFLWRANKKYDDLMCAKDHMALYGHTRKMERKFVQTGHPEAAKDIREATKGGK